LVVGCEVVEAVGVGVEVEVEVEVEGPEAEEVEGCGRDMMVVRKRER
jgi:hypothetical protein